jgi:hypothetical protein
MDELLLDTTYLLPIFGLKVDLEDFEIIFPELLATRSISFNPIALVESKWIVLKLIRKNPSTKNILLEAYRLGLKTLKEDHRLRQTALTDETIEEIADKLYHEGLKDYFDRLIYATAVRTNSSLLTEDEELHKLGESSHWHRQKRIINWEKLKEL